MEAVDDLGQRQGPHPRRGEFDGQRHAVEPPADLAHRGGAVGGDGEVGPGQPGAVGEQLDRLVGHDSGGTRHVTSPATPIGSRLVAKIVNLGHAPSSAAISAAHASSRCSQLSSTTSVCRSPMNRTRVSTVERPGWSGNPSARADVAGTSAGSVIGARSTYQTPPGYWPPATAISSARRVLPTPPAPVRVTSRLTASSRRTLRHLVNAANETRELGRKTRAHQRLPGPQRRELVVQIGMTQLHHPFRSGQVPQTVGAQVGEPRIVGQEVGNQITCGSRQHRLAAMGELTQPGGPVDRRADVITLIAQSHLTGVHANTQPDRRQRRPLQVDGARHGIGCAGERDHEAVTFALLDRTHPMMGAHQFGERAIQVATATPISSGSAAHRRVEPSTSASSNVTVPVGTPSLTPSHRSSPTTPYPRPRESLSW